jgi:hypothetical protein
MPQPPNSQTLTPNPKAVDHNRRPVRRRLAVSRPAHQPPEFEEIIREEKVNAGDLLLFLICYFSLSFSFCHLIPPPLPHTLQIGTALGLSLNQESSPYSICISDKPVYVSVGGSLMALVYFNVDVIGVGGDQSWSGYFLFFNFFKKYF